MRQRKEKPAVFANKGRAAKHVYDHVLGQTEDPQKALAAARRVYRDFVPPVWKRR